MKYRAWCCVQRVEVFEIDRETEKSVWLKESPNRRELKISDGLGYFDTWEEARAFLLEKADEELQSASATLRYYKDEYEKVNRLKKD